MAKSHSGSRDAFHTHKGKACQLKLVIKFGDMQTQIFRCSDTYADEIENQQSNNLKK